ncbi:hypothetical protein PM082_001883 [Marasmius tenuissimus]|nr:hypothetical protein PM082_001883 [Marasmius tenuissimus]
MVWYSMGPFAISMIDLRSKMYHGRENARKKFWVLNAQDMGRRRLPLTASPTSYSTRCDSGKLKGLE